MSNTESSSLTDRRTVTVLAVVLLMLGAALVGMGTYAYFTDTESSSENPAQAGTLDLTLDGNNGDVTTSFSLTGADHVQVAISASENDDGLSEPSDPDLANDLGSADTQKHIEVVKYEYQDDGGTTNQDILADVSDANGNGIKDLEDVISQKGTVDDLAAPQANGGNTMKLVLEVKIANDDGSYSGTDEDIMGDGVDIKIDVTLNQDSSQ